MKKVVVIGHGYVGSGMAAMFKRNPKYDVFAFDIAQNPLQREFAMGADLAVICVPTPQGPDGRADVSAVEEVLRWCDAPLVVVKSTVPPGTTDRLNEQEVKSHRVLHPRIHFSPEYMGEPINYVPGHLYPHPTKPWQHDFVIVGGPTPHAVLEYFKTVMATSARFFPVMAIQAELAKYMENAYYATLVTFCNEFARIAGRFGVYYDDLRELWLLDSRISRDHTVVFADSPGFGGKCLPKDLSAIIMAATDAGYTPGLLRAVMHANTRHRGVKPKESSHDVSNGSCGADNHSRDLEVVDECQP